MPGKGYAQAGWKGERITEVTFAVRPIGVVRKTERRTLIVLDRKYQPGLLGLDGFSHVYVLWWFDRNDTPERRATLQVHPMGNRKNPLTGVFATRSPRRPNLIALTLCKIVSVKENVVEVEAIDAFADTPVLDMKPFIPGYDSTADAHSPE
jgi:tRNA-Thr(GGU) m(6)t(6)A37 methyltransferase TsaA